jgi:hypothetical protein
MAFSELEVARIKKAVDAFMVKRRPPPHIRPKLDFGSRIKNQSIELFEIRPVWRGKPGELREHPFAKATLVRSRGMWRVFWLRQDLKWHAYEPAAEVRSIDDFLQVVSDDEYACFFG